MDEWAPYGVAVDALVYAGRLGEAEELLTCAWGLVVDQPGAKIRGYIADGSLPCTSNKAACQRLSPGY